MINKIIRYYNQNRKAIIIFIIFVAFIIFLVQSLNKVVEKKNQDILKKQNNIINAYNNNFITNVMDQSNNIDTSNNNMEKTIEEFVEYCNQGEIDKAYNLLSDDCKKVNFTNKEKFKSEYCDKIFKSKKMYSLESSKYGSAISKITYYNDALSTGTLTDSKYVDYIYTVNENGQKKISINGFLYIEKLEKKYEGNSIDIKVIEKQVYIDYEIYKINFTNNSENKILIDTRKDKNSTSVSDDSETKYPSYVDNMATDMLIINSKISRTIDIKFNKMYNNNRKVKVINFLDIVSNYDDYIAGKQYETIKVSINL